MIIKYKYFAFFYTRSRRLEYGIAGSVFKSIVGFIGNFVKFIRIGNFPCIYISFSNREFVSITVKCFEDNSKVKELLATPGAGRVLFVDGGGSLRRALLGDLIAASAVKQGWSGVVVYGAVRDVDALAEMDLGVQALGTTPLKTERRGLGDANVPVRVAGVSIKSGDWLYADNNGVIISPRALLMG